MERGRQRRERVARCGFFVCMAFLGLAAALSVAAPITIEVRAKDGTLVGNVSVDVKDNADGTNKGVVGGFTSTYPQPPPDGAKPSLSGAAQKMGEDHFNWIQVVVSDNKPPNAADGTPMKPRIWILPQEAMKASGPIISPWYWDEGADPAPGTPGWKDGYNLDDNTLDENMDGENEFLHFEDFPWGEVGTQLQFGTWLASINADGSLHSLHGGFVWTWERTNPGLAMLIRVATPEEGLAYYWLLVPEPGTSLLWITFVLLAIPRRWNH